MNFICLSYKKYDYLIKKDSISESLYLGANTTKSFSREIKILEENQTVINLDYIVEKKFGDEEFSDESMLLQISDIYCESTAEAYVKDIDLSEFRLFGSTMDSFFNKNGLLAIRYLTNNRIQYLLDIEKFIKTFKEKEND